MAQTVVLFDRFGPYHVARLAAAARRTPLVGIEVYGESAEYAWDRVDSGAQFGRVTLFPEADARGVRRADVRRAVWDALGRIRPGAVALPGWSHPAALAALAWCTGHGVPGIVMSESNAWDEVRDPRREWIKRRIVGQCRSGLVGGEGHREYLASLGLPREAIFLGYDAVDNDHFADGARRARSAAAQVRARLGLPERYWLASARFVAKKNLPRLLQAFANYRRGASSAPRDLVLIGDGELRADVESIRAELGLNGCVHLPGFVQYEHLPEYYGLAEGFVHASTVEQWGLVVNEAMAAGLPVLVSQPCGCAAHLVEPQCNGAVFDPFDVDGLAARLQWLAERSAGERESMGRHSERIIAEWGTQRFASGLESAVQAARRAGGSPPSMLDRALVWGLGQRA